MVEPESFTKEMRSVRKWLAGNFMPYMMVQASATALKKMAINNLSPAEFMRPFGDVGNLGGYAMRTVDKNEVVKL